MPEDYATKDDLRKIEDRLWGHKPPLFENDVGDIGKLKADLDIVKTQQKELLDWKRRLSSAPAKILMGLSAAGIFIAAVNGIITMVGH